MYPNLKKGVVFGLVGGFVAAMLVFGLCFWMSTLPAVTPASLSLAFRPWWRESNWLAALVACLSTGLVFAILAALRPDLRGKGRQPRL
jgi:amino acid transporter